MASSSTSVKWLLSAWQQQPHQSAPRQCHRLALSPCCLCWPRWVCRRKTFLWLSPSTGSCEYCRQKMGERTIDVKLMKAYRTKKLTYFERSLFMKAWPEHLSLFFFLFSLWLLYSTETAFERRLTCLETPSVQVGSVFRVKRRFLLWCYYRKKGSEMYTCTAYYEMNGRAQVACEADGFINLSCCFYSLSLYILLQTWDLHSLLPNLSPAAHHSFLLAISYSHSHPTLDDRFLMPLYTFPLISINAALDSSRSFPLKSNWCASGSLCWCVLVCTVAQPNRREAWVWTFELFCV